MRHPQGRGAVLLVGLVVGPGGLDLPGRHADPGADAHLHPEDRSWPSR